MAESRGENKDQAAIIKRLKLQITDLEIDRNLKAPIIQIGVDVRLRNLEQTREALNEVPRAQVDHTVVMNGNIAAHRANGTVDAALIKTGLVPDDCHATIIAVKALDHRTSSSGLRDKFHDVEERLLELKNTKNVREFESDLEVDVLLGQLERLTQMIVILEGPEAANADCKGSKYVLRHGVSYITKLIMV